MSVAEAKIRFRATTAKELQENPLLAAESVAAVGLGGKPWGEEENPQTVAVAAASSLLGSMITPEDQAKLEKLDRQCRSLVESPLSSDQVDWFNGAVAEKDKQEARRIAREQMARMRRDSVLRWERQAEREGWATPGRSLSSVKSK